MTTDTTIHTTDDDLLLDDCFEDEPQATDEGQAFRIDNEARAAWAVNKMLGFDEEEARLDAQYKAMKENLSKRREAFRARFFVELEDWLRGALAGGKRKSLDLLTGRVGLRAKKAGFLLRDKKAALEWAKEHEPSLVLTEQVTVEKLDTDAAKERAAELQQAGDGETIPGLEWQDAHDALYVEARKGGAE